MKRRVLIYVLNKRSEFRKIVWETFYGPLKRIKTSTVLEDIKSGLVAFESNQVAITEFSFCRPSTFLLRTKFFDPEYCKTWFIRQNPNPSITV